MKLDRGGPTFPFLARIRWGNLALVIAAVVALTGLAVWSLKSSSSPQIPPAAARAVGTEFDTPSDLPVEKVEESSTTREFNGPEPHHRDRSKRPRRKRMKNKRKKSARMKKVTEPQTNETTPSPTPAPPTYSPPPQSPPNRGWQHEFSPG